MQTLRGESSGNLLRPGRCALPACLPAWPSLCSLSPAPSPCGASPRNGRLPCSGRPTGCGESRAWSSPSGCRQWPPCSTQTSWPPVSVLGGECPAAEGAPAGAVLTVTLPARLPQCLCATLAVWGGLPAARPSLRHPPGEWDSVPGHLGHTPRSLDGLSSRREPPLLARGPAEPSLLLPLPPPWVLGTRQGAHGHRCDGLPVMGSVWQCQVDAELGRPLG